MDVLKGTPQGASVFIPTSNEQVERPIFVSLQERKDLVHGMKQSRSRATGTNHTYVIKFFLVDSRGLYHHAATGIDGGDSHYEYKNEPGYPHLQCHNKSEVKQWAERVIAESQAQSGYHTDIVKDEVPSHSSLINLPKFVSYSEKKTELPDGRHQICWYLLDEAGHNHLAVVGDEKETRDGHYIYHTENIFDKAAHLHAHNQEEVKRWLNWMIGPRTEPLTPKFFANLRSRSKTKPARSKSKSQTVSPRPRGRGRGRPPRPSIFGANAFGGANMVGMRRGRGNFRVYDLDFDCRSVTAVELRKWLEEEVKMREATKSAAFAFVDETVPVYENDILEKNVQALQASHEKICASKELCEEDMVDSISALRELYHLRPTLKMAKNETLTTLLKDIMDMGPPLLREPCEWIFKNLLQAMAAHTGVLLEERYVRDPRPNMEKVINNAAQFDPLVTSLTHRQLGPRLQYPEAEVLSTPIGQSPSIGGDEKSHFTDTNTSAGPLGPQTSSDSLLEENNKVVEDDDVAILPPAQQQMSIRGIEY